MNTAITKTTCLLSRFVDQFAKEDIAKSRLNVNDLKAGIRQERLKELGDWSNCELDAIELHAAQFPGDLPLNSIFERSFDRFPANKDVLISKLCAPSPFAWT